MEQSEIFERVVKILTPYVKSQEALDKVTLATHILEDLKVNSARLVALVSSMSSSNPPELPIPY